MFMAYFNEDIVRSSLDSVFVGAAGEPVVCDVVVVQQHSRYTPGITDMIDARRRTNGTSAGVLHHVLVEGEQMFGELWKVPHEHNIVNTSQYNFLKEADLFGFYKNTDRIDRAFIVPNGGIDSLGPTPITLFWYRRSNDIPILKGDVVHAKNRQGDEYTVTIQQNVPYEMKVRLKTKTYIRTCTGVVSGVVEKNPMT